MPSHRILFPVFAAACALALEAAAVPPRPGALPFPTGRITYKIQGPGLTGTSVVAWTDGGRKMRYQVEGVASAGGVKRSFATWTMTDGRYTYVQTDNLVEEVVRMKARKPRGGGTALPFIPGYSAKGKKAGAATVLGKRCEVRVVGRDRFCVWRGIPLKAEQRLAPAAGAGARTGTTVATRLEISPKLPARLFQVPPGFKIRDAAGGK